MSTGEVWLWVLVCSPFFIIVMAYGVGRAFAIGHFKTKLEYLRSMIKELGESHTE
jgi:hypothetical protein